MAAAGNSDNAFSGIPYPASEHGVFKIFSVDGMRPLQYDDWAVNYRFLTTVVLLLVRYDHTLTNYDAVKFNAMVPER